MIKSSLSHQQNQLSNQSFLLAVCVQMVKTLDRPDHPVYMISHVPPDYHSSTLTRWVSSPATTLADHLPPLVNGRLLSKQISKQLNTYIKVKRAEHLTKLVSLVGLQPEPIEPHWTPSELQAPQMPIYLFPSLPNEHEKSCVFLYRDIKQSNSTLYNSSTKKTTWKHSRDILK